MSVANSITSLEDYQSEAALAQDNENRNAGVGPSASRSKRKRLSFRRRGKKDNDADADAEKGPASQSEPEKEKQAKGLSCGCRGAIKLFTLIVIVSFVELLGCILALVYGVTYIQNASRFYELDSEQQEYKDMFDRIVFLDKYRIGYVALLATCVVGVAISLIMPLGAIYKSWKCLRASMSLLFSLCLVHLILIAIYLPCNGLMASAAAIPFRVLEIFLILRYIKHYKRKKLEELKERVKKAGGRVLTPAEEAAESQQLLGMNSSRCACPHERAKLLSQPNAPASSEVQIPVDSMAALSSPRMGDQPGEENLGIQTQDEVPKPKKHKHKRKVHHHTNKNKDEVKARLSGKYDPYNMQDAMK